MKLRLTSCTLAAALIAGCGSGTNNGTTPVMGGAAPNISGDYTGTMNDAQSGAGQVNSATFAQSGDTVGGSMTGTFAASTLPVQMTLTITPVTNATGGSMVIDYPPAGTGPQCTFTTSGTYNQNTNVLSGSYTAVSGCSGDSGTYTLTQQCTATVTAVRRLTLPPKC